METGLRFPHHRWRPAARHRVAPKENPRGAVPPGGFRLGDTRFAYGATMQRCAEPVKLMTGGEPQIAPPKAAGALMVAGWTVENSRSCSGAALENTVPPPATETVLPPTFMHAPTAPLPTHVPVPDPVQQVY